MYFWCSYVCEGGYSVTVQRRQSDLIEINDAQFSSSGSGEGGCGVRTDSADSNNDDEGVAEFFEAVVGEEDAVAGELFQDEFCVFVRNLCFACRVGER